MATKAASVTAAMTSGTTLADKFKNFSGKLFNKKFFIIIILIAIFVGVAVYVYNTYVSPRINPEYVPNAEWVSTEEVEGAYMYLFTVDWCPYSKKTKPVWNKFKKKLNNNLINGIKLNFVEIDGEKNTKELEKFEERYLGGKKIEGYPTIYLVKSNQVIEYEAKPDVNTLTEFVNSVL